jgi:hypothetical protein
VSLDAQGLFDAVASHAEKLGLFASTGTHEPKNAPPNGITCAIWIDQIGPVPAGSGLAAATARVVFMVRIYSPMLSIPYDAIDPDVLSACSVLLGEYAGSFTLGGLIRNVDILGATGTPLSAKAGYLTQDNKLFRVMDITLPLIVNDVWSEVA